MAIPMLLVILTVIVPCQLRPAVVGITVPDLRYRRLYRLMILAIITIISTSPHIHTMLDIRHMVNINNITSSVIAIHLLHTMNAIGNVIINIIHVHRGATGPLAPLVPVRLVKTNMMSISMKTSLTGIEGTIMISLVLSRVLSPLHLSLVPMRIIVLREDKKGLVLILLLLRLPVHPHHPRAIMEGKHQEYLDDLLWEGARSRACL